MMQRELAAFCAGMALIVVPFFVLHGNAVRAQTAEQLQKQISDSNSKLADIQKEIDKYQSELTKVGAQKDTLQKAINQLELQQKKVEADIAYTQNKIGATDLEISKLNIDIGSTQNSITKNKVAIGEVIRDIDETDQYSLVEALLSHNSLVDFWQSAEQLQGIRDVMSNEVRSLVSQKQLLESKRSESNDKRSQLVDLKSQYNDQNTVLSNNQDQKSKLLTQTKSQESNYQKLLAEKKAAKDEIEKELRDYESQLQFILDPNSIPPAGTPVFNFPLKNIIVTQRFGGTEFAKRNASVYGGRPYHPGIDFGASVGTPIYAPLAGTVRAIGNTDAVPGCYSWGKWTLIDHANGLSTLYAHQSVISVQPGESVKTGQIIGYTGNTGYTTGPHLHFTVYVKAAVTVKDFAAFKPAGTTSCGGATTPVAATSGYLDPELYLPPIAKSQFAL